MADHAVDLGDSDVSLTAAVNDTITVTNKCASTINVVTATGLNPQGSTQLAVNASTSYTVVAFPGGTNNFITFHWNEVGARGQRTGTINPG